MMLSELHQLNDGFVNNVLLDDIFAGGRAFGTGVSFSVGNTHIIIDTGDSEVMSGDIPVGGLAYHLQRNQKAKHSVPLLLLATRLLNEQRHNQRNFLAVDMLVVTHRLLTMQIILFHIRKKVV